MLSLPYDLAASRYRRYPHPVGAGQRPGAFGAACRVRPPITLEPPSTASYQREEKLSLDIPLVIPPHMLGLCRAANLLLGHDEVEELGGVDEVVVAVVAGLQFDQLDGAGDLRRAAPACGSGGWCS